jgi:uncharacterized protein
MHLTLHLSNQCNMRCHYCYVEKGSTVMSSDTLKKAIALAVRQTAGQTVGIAFFGGEPLLHMELITEAVEYCHQFAEHEGVRFNLKLTTNGLLLNDTFLDYADREGIFVALSIDGIVEAHDFYRMDTSRQGTHTTVLAAAHRLLARQKYSPAMMVVNPATVTYFARGVDFLYRSGFRYIISSLNFAADWDSAALRKLKRQYMQLSAWYYEHTLIEEKFYLSPFEAKIESHVKGNNWCVDRCELGRKRMSVAPSGVIFPCTQFVDDKNYAIGHVDTGIDEELRMRIFERNHRSQPECLGCAIKSRCLHTCGCLNKQVTGSIDHVAPSLCAHERLLLPIVDRLASRLYQKRNAMFIHKHYNDMYPVISAVEDQASSIPGQTTHVFKI